MKSFDGFNLTHQFAKLPGFSVPFQPRKVAHPRLVFLNRPLAIELGLPSGLIEDSLALADLFSGNVTPMGASPVAQVYAGHQFGHFAPRLGDGRATLLGELKRPDGHLVDLALKGSGGTPFARNGDGLAALGPMLREAIMGEAMHALGVPTTRALAVVATGEDVHREQILPGAVLTRVADSHIRVGTFEYFASRGEVDHVRTLADYTIKRHFSDLPDDASRYGLFLEAVIHRQATLIARWMGLGFIHGVMNTDNMVLSGQTIDYGPCAWMERYSPDAVFSSIDRQGRYAFHNQPAIAQWNLACFAETLLPLLSPNHEQAMSMAQSALEGFQEDYDRAFLKELRAKLGLPSNADRVADDQQLISEWLGLLHTNKVDMTLGFWHLSDVLLSDGSGLRRMFSEVDAVESWLARWRVRCEAAGISPEDRATAMRQVNPIIVPRNHHVERALEAASFENDFGPFDALLAAVTNPFDPALAESEFASPAPAGFSASYRTFCGT